jgi:cytochrome c553
LPSITRSITFTWINVRVSGRSIVERCGTSELSAMPKHIWRLILLLIGFGIVAVTVRSIVVDRSFYEYGHYRGDAVAEIARDKPKFQGTAYCQSCHAAEYNKWAQSPHNRPEIGNIVKCEVCHGPGASRDPEQNYIHAATGPIHPNNLKLVVPGDTTALCTVCHEEMAGRPAQQRQIVIRDHAGTQQCSLCHDSHAPRTFKGALVALAAPGDAAAGKSRIAACAACHGPGGVSAAGLMGPTLAGQNRAYLAAALTAYKTGARKNPIMSGMVAALSNTDIQDIAAYFSGQQCAVGSSAADQIAAARKAGAAMCTSCHGANGVPTGDAWPHLVGQSKDYLQSALKSYASGDRSHVVMSALAKSLNDVDAAKVAAYYSRAICK